MRRVLTSECVGYGHPDKVADQISDALLDAYIEKDANAHVAVETLVKDNHIVVAGEVTGVNSEKVNVEQVIRNAAIEAGYNDDKLGFNGNTCHITNLISKQSAEIHNAVENDHENIGAGDQGIMFGYASNDTPDYMPMTIWLSRVLLNCAMKTRDLHPGRLHTDCKSQISVEYDGNKAIAIKDIVFSIHHEKDVTREELNNLWEETVRSFKQILKDNEMMYLWNDDIHFHINPAGLWTFGGPAADSGLTGRKIVVDQYGCHCPIGGGAFSGKNPTKVDRSAAYIARNIAKSIVANGYSDICQVELSYAIGVKEPTAINIECFDTNKIDITEIINKVQNSYNLTPNGIIKCLDLKKPIYHRTAKCGHFGINGYKWEEIKQF
ncbi:MAG: methionine adenosyltransferase [Candidatus Delongbacteria bacterium]|nr:methionine adenosyltransferase [Candidatus Delongbacteria bacterium]MBN2833553.1 methionine adenosyltransferase [Candidatus Delongbacteria bacterium]